MSVLIVGSTGLDDVETPAGKRKNALGGSAFYAATASSFFAPTAILGIVGEDFPHAHIRFLEHRKIDLSGLEIVHGGKTFRWSGRYHTDMNSRDTLDLQLNTFLQFAPKLNDAAKNKKFLFLANIDPELHLDVLKQTKQTKFVLADTMDFWIKTKLPALRKLMKKVDTFVINESEAKLLTGEINLIKAASDILKMGPRYVLVKKGEHGSFLYDGKDLFIAPAYPLPRVVDPTGAGDTFAGAFIGYLASRGAVTPATLRSATVYGSVVASYTCEAFSIEMLKMIRRKDIEKRFKELGKLTKF